MRTFIFGVIWACAMLTWSSVPSAEMLVYLDFDGHSESNYNGISIAVPPFTGSETAKQDILRRMEEDYAPYDVRFTLEEPLGIGSGFNNQIRVAIGGMEGDLGTARSGWATNPFVVNTVWSVEFTSDGIPRGEREIANTASHELGHAFGHVAFHVAPPHWQGSNVFFVSHYVAEITPDSSRFTQPQHYLIPLGKTQIMNGPRGLVRDIWWKDRNVLKAFRLGGDPENFDDWILGWQDDILSLAGALGMRADDHADWPPSAGTPMLPFAGTPLPTETRLEGDGIVEINSESWPGVCPPTPPYSACVLPPGDDPDPDDGIPVGIPDPGQDVVLALPRDFFRFQVTQLNALVDATFRVVVNTIDTGPNDFAANLDADVEVWYDDPATGSWEEITGLGTRLEGSAALGVIWEMQGRQLNPLAAGGYAVAVKSAGEYGDLGRYTLSVSGFDGVMVAAISSPVRAPTSTLRTRDLLAMVETTSTRSELVHLLALLAEFGVDEAAPDKAKKRNGERRVPLTPSASTLRMINVAIRQTSLLQVAAQLIDWRETDRERQAADLALLKNAIARIEDADPGVAVQATGCDYAVESPPAE